MEIQDFLTPENNNQPTQPASSPLVSLKKDLDFYAESILEISTEIIAEGLSRFPIFIAHQHEVHVGELILDKEELGTSWSIQASTFEEFVEKGIIKEDRKTHFLNKYKKPEEYMCLFVVVPEGANFVFYPYAKDSKNPA